MSNFRWTAMLIPILLLGCAKQAALETTATDSAMRGAEVAGAQDVPQASLHLQLAKEQLEQAEKLNESGDEDEAKSMLARAAADAELALLLSNEKSERDQADAALAQVEALRAAK